MPYDFDLAPDCLPPKVDIRPAQATDLEAIVTLIEVAAILLTQDQGQQFTAVELLHEAQATAGEDLQLDPGDFHLVLEHAGFLEKHSGGLFSLK